MGNITLDEILNVLKYVGTFAAAIGAVYAILMKGIKKLLEPTNKEIASIRDDIKKEKEDRTKSELITFMYLAENGGLSDEQSKFAHELYDEYTKAGLNSYVHDKFEKLKKEGKI